MDYAVTLQTGYGSWNPIAWLIAFIIALIILYLLWLRGEKGYKIGTEQTKPYLSGNVEPEKGAVHIRASNLYWGFSEALKGYYGRVVPAHSGSIVDYVVWYLLVTAALLIIVVLV